MEKKDRKISSDKVADERKVLPSDRGVDRERGAQSPGVQPFSAVAVKRLVGKRSSKGVKGGFSPLSAAPLKAPSSGSGAFPAGLLDPNTIYRFRLCQHNYFTSNGSGVLSGYISCDPATTTFPEYAELITLFSEVRLAKAMCAFGSDVGAAARANYPLPIAWDDENVASTPTSVDNVIDNARLFYHHLGNTWTMTTCTVNTKDREWASTATPSPGPYAGCTGEFLFYQNGLSNNLSYVEYYLTVEYEFRNRR